MATVAEETKTVTEEPKTVVEGTKRKRKNVVIAVDGSVYSNLAYRWYLDNCRSEDDNVYLVHAVETNEMLSSQQFSSPYSFDADVLASVLKKERQRVTDILKQFADLLTQTGVNGTVRSVHTTSPGEGIIKVAKEVDADMIVVGCRGMGKIRRTLLGCTSDYILHHSPVDVIVHICPIISEKRKMSLSSQSSRKNSLIGSSSRKNSLIDEFPRRLSLSEQSNQERMFHDQARRKMSLW